VEFVAEIRRPGPAILPGCQPDGALDGDDTGIGKESAVLNIIRRSVWHRTGRRFDRLFVKETRQENQL